MYLGKREKITSSSCHSRLIPCLCALSALPLCCRACSTVGFKPVWLLLRPAAAQAVWWTAAVGYRSQLPAACQRVCSAWRIPATPSLRAFNRYKRGCTFPEQGQGVKWEQGKREKKLKKEKMRIPKSKEEQEVWWKQAPSLRFRRLSVSCLVRCTWSMAQTSN